jgi:hypothetical protein
MLSSGGPVVPPLTAHTRVVWFPGVNSTSDNSSRFLALSQDSHPGALRASSPFTFGVIPPIPCHLDHLDLSACLPSIMFILDLQLVSTS